MAVSYEIIAKALFINYESLYDIDMSTGEYLCFYQSESYEKFKLSKQGTDFFGALRKAVPGIIELEDQEYVMSMLSKESLLQGTQDSAYYSFVYRVRRGGRPIYHKIRAKKENIDGNIHIYLGIRDIDYLIRQEKKHSEEMNSLLQKEHNHMNAVLASAEGYLEINLTKDVILERRINGETMDGIPLAEIPISSNTKRYSRTSKWILEHLLATNHDAYNLVTSREYLLKAFERGERRVTIEFAFKDKNEQSRPCKQIFFLYRDDTSGDVMSFCVIYDLTEPQRKEKEMQELTQKLQLSRIRNFAGQMQPHFLYNALGSIQEIILEDPAYAFDMLGDFTIYLRGCIRSMADDKAVRFSQELDNIRAYVNIEKMRFGDKLKVVYNLETTNFQVLPLSIQPIVENAIRHGIYMRGSAGGTVTLKTLDNNSYWIVQVIDDGVGFDYGMYQKETEGRFSEATGLKNLMFRLKTVLGADVKVDSIIGEGTTVTVLIPKEKGDYHDESHNS